MGWRAEDLDSSVQVHYKEGGDSSLCFLLMEVPWALERASGGNQHPQITRAGFSVHQQIPDNQLKTLGFITEGFPEVAATAKSLQSCLTLCDPIDGSPQGSPVPGILQAPGKNTGMGCHFVLQCIKVKSEREVAQSCPTLSDPTDYSLPGSSIHGIFQARVLEWGAIAFPVPEVTGNQTRLILWFTFWSLPAT